MKNIMQDDRFSKLPKWAKDGIRDLTIKINQLQDDNKVLHGTHPDSNTYTRERSTDNRIYLPDYSRVHFLGNQEVMVMVDLQGHIRVEVDNGVIIPWARNVIMIADSGNKLKY